MNFFAINRNDTKVSSSSNTFKDRQPVDNYYTGKRHGINTQKTPQTGQQWDGIERRNGEERRQENTVKQARLDARNKTDRRASRLSVQI